MQTTSRPALPPFTEQTAIEKVRLAEDGWNSRDPSRVALAHAVDSSWRNRVEFVTGQQAIKAKYFGGEGVCHAIEPI
jgi:nuclear transport factor 2 (NTF2) superfamily protein